MRRSFIRIIVWAGFAVSFAGCVENSTTNVLPGPPPSNSSVNLPLTEQEIEDDISKNVIASAVNFREFLGNYPIFKKLEQELIFGGRADVYTLHLHHAGEPDLGTVRAKKGEAYRLITMDGGVRISNLYRIEKLNDQITLTTKKVDTIGLYSGMPAKVDISLAQKLSVKEWLEFQTLLDRVSFWGLPTANTVSGLDGEFYLTEGVTPAKHHLVARWSEAPATYRALFDYLANLSEQAAIAKENSAPPAALEQ